MKSENFLNYRNWFFAKLCLGVVTVSFLLYLLDHPIGGRRGNTLLGYVFGSISLLIIIYLTYFGIRKRAYFSGRGRLVAHLSAHVWFGISVLFLVPLHSGFHFGKNIHSLAYFLMVIVIVSGMLGALFYRKLPSALSSQRGGVGTKQLLGMIKELDSEINVIADISSDLRSLVRQFDLPTDGYLRGSVMLKRLPALEMRKISKSLSEFSSEFAESGTALLELIAKKRELLQTLVSEVRAAALLKVWLFIHIPFTCVFLVVLCVHIFFAIFYWT